MHPLVQFRKGLEIGIGEAPHQRDVVVHRALGWPGGAGGVDQHRDIVGLDRIRASNEEIPALARKPIAPAPHHLVEADQAIVPILKERADIKDDDLADLRQPARRAQSLVDEFLVLGQEEDGPAVVQLILDLTGRTGGVNAVAHGAAAQCRHVGNQKFATRIGHGRDTVAGLHAEQLPDRQETPRRRPDRPATSPPDRGPGPCGERRRSAASRRTAPRTTAECSRSSVQEPAGDCNLPLTSPPGFTSPRLRGEVKIDASISHALAYVHPHALFLRHFAHDGEAHFAAVAAALVSAIGRHRADRAPGIDPDVAGFECLRRAHGAADVAGYHGGGEAERTVIGERERFRLLP